jgi:hypothetical protein
MLHSAVFLSLQCNRSDARCQSEELWWRPDGRHSGKQPIGCSDWASGNSEGRYAANAPDKAGELHARLASYTIMHLHPQVEGIPGAKSCR